MTLFQQTSVICIGRHVGGQGGLNYFLSLQEDLWYSEKSVGFLGVPLFSCDSNNTFMLTL